LELRPFNAVGRVYGSVSRGSGGGTTADKKGVLMGWGWPLSRTNTIKLQAAKVIGSWLADGPGKGSRTRRPLFATQRAANQAKPF
jgi:hypothetical protein